MPTTPAELFLEHARPERLRAFLGRPVEAVRSQLREELGNNSFAILEASTTVKGIPPRTTIVITPYLDDPRAVKAVSLSLGAEVRLKDGAAPEKFVASMLACWHAVTAALPDRVGPLTKQKTLHPQKNPVVAAAPAMKLVLKDAWAFEGGTLEHHATTQRDLLFTYDLSLTFRR